MKIINAILAVTIIAGLISCSRGLNGGEMQQAASLTPEQEQLASEGWYMPKTPPTGELAKEYGVKARFGRQDNYFDIEIGKGSSVAVKIIDATTQECIRYVLVPENSSVSVQMIPQGKYYLKLAYGKDWMEYDNGDGTIAGKFTKDVSYGKSVDIFDFGKKNSSSIISYTLQINVENSKLQNNFATIDITESEFLK